MKIADIDRCNECRYCEDWLIDRDVSSYCDKQNIEVNTMTPACPLFRDAYMSLAYTNLEEVQNFDEWIA